MGKIERLSTSPATLVPQRLPDSWYQAHYSSLAYTLIYALGMEEFFRSALFLVPVGIFTINLGVCAVDRFVRRAHRGAPNRFGPDLVLPTLQTTHDANVFAIGDCAACPWLGHDGKTVPPRAQSAHQQASHMMKQIRRRLAGRPLAPYRYRDFGSLVSLGEYSTVGNLMGALVGKNFWIEGWFARVMYLSLYKMHELALHGFWKTALDTAARMITRRTEPHVKLH